MALLSSEIARIKYELGYNALSVGAEPYIGVTQLFEQVIAQYMTAGASTTSSTAVTAASTPTAVTLTLASATGFSAGDRIVVDVDSLQESAVVRSVSGATVTVLLSKAHAGTYPVTVEGGETIVRAILQKLQALSALAAGGEAGALGGLSSSVGIKKVDEIEFFGGGSSALGGASRLSELIKLQDYWRDELAHTLGVVRLNGRGGGGASVSMY